MKRQIIFSIIFIVIISIAVMVSYNTSVEALIGEETGLFIDVRDFSPSFEKNILEKGEEGLRSYSVTVDLEDMPSHGEDGLMILVNKMTDHAMEIRLNGTLVTAYGDMKRGRSQIKNGFIYGYVDDTVLKEVNTLKLDTYASYKSGTDAPNVYILNRQVGRRIVHRLRFNSYRTVEFGLGFVACAAIFMGLIYVTSIERNQSFIYCAMATVFFGIYFIDYLQIENLRWSYLVSKKIYLMALYIGGTFYTLAMSRFLQSRLLRYTSMVNMTGFTLIVLFANDGVTFKTYYDRWYVLFLMNILLALIMSIVHIRRNPYIYLFVVGFFATSVYSGISIMLELTGRSFSINSPSVYIIILAMLPILVGTDHLLYSEGALRKEKSLREKAYFSARTDGLTGVWNQTYLFECLDEINGRTTMAILDLDNFKTINDTYGHLAGDHILISICAGIQETFGDRVLCFRYGGDEFVLISYNMSSLEMEEHLEAYLKQVSEKTFLYDNQMIRVTLSAGIGETMEGEGKTLLEVADRCLYKSKHSGKNKVVSMNAYNTTREVVDVE